MLKLFKCICGQIIFEIDISLKKILLPQKMAYVYIFSQWLLAYKYPELLKYIN